MEMNERESKVAHFQVWLSDWINQTDPRSATGVALKEADDALDLLFELAGEEN